MSDQVDESEPTHFGGVYAAWNRPMYVPEGALLAVEDLAFETIALLIDSKNAIECLRGAKQLQAA